MPKEHTEETKLKIAKSMMGNQNSSKWTIEMAIQLFQDAIALTEDPEIVFIGSIAKRLKTTRSQMYYLATERFKTELYPLHKELMENLEANCFELSLKKGVNYQPLLFALKSFYPESWNPVEKKEVVTTNNQIVWKENKTYITKGEEPMQIVHPVPPVPLKKYEGEEDDKENGVGF